MPRALTAVMISTLLWLNATAAQADTSATAPAADVVRLSADWAKPAAANESSSRTTPAGRQVSVGAGNSFPLNPVRTQPNGQFCSVAGALNFGRSYAVGNIPACPSVPGAPAPPPPTPLEAAYQAWYTEVVLPDPILATNPTRAITGLDTFLVMRRTEDRELVGDRPRPAGQPQGRQHL